MPRLIDDLRNAGCFAMPWFVLPDKQAEWAEYAQRIWDYLQDRSLPVLLIDNVADYFFQSDQEFWSLDKDFPNLAPPYPSFWCEHRLPGKIHSAEKGDTDMSQFVSKARIGTLITAIPKEDVTGTGIEEMKWLLWCELFIDYGRNFNGPVCGPNGTIMVPVDEHGRVLEVPRIMTYCGPGRAEMMKHYITWLHPSFLAVSFLHCKNVRVDDNRMPKPLAKKYRAKHGTEPAPYKTLVIEPLKQILKSQGRSGEVGLAKALYICRGHFKDYREGRGLFGKYHQLVWQPSLVRGTKGKEAPPREVKIKV